MFNMAKKFSQPLNWNVAKVLRMDTMFYYATAFNQNLGWCVAGGVNVDTMFYKAKCATTTSYIPSTTPVCGVTKSGSCP